MSGDYPFPKTSVTSCQIHICTSWCTQPISMLVILNIGVYVPPYTYQTHDCNYILGYENKVLEFQPLCLKIMMTSVAILRGIKIILIICHSIKPFSSAEY